MVAVAVLAAVRMDRQSALAKAAHTQCCKLHANYVCMLCLIGVYRLLQMALSKFPSHCFGANAGLSCSVIGLLLRSGMGFALGMPMPDCQCAARMRHNLRFIVCLKALGMPMRSFQAFAH